jgi:8-oxo-dGTP pyrophosphatase MutT (NUDIX family)
MSVFHSTTTLCILFSRCLGALRETVEEAGVHVRLVGVLQVDVLNGGQYRRVIFYAEPEPPDQAPKTWPDIESVGACWATAEELQVLLLLLLLLLQAGE